MSAHDVSAPTDPSTWRDRIQSHGYVIVRGVIPQDMLEATIADVWRHTGADPHDRDSWYQRPEVIRPGGMVEMYHYQSMWDNRQYPALYDVFRAVHGTDELAVSMDRIGLKPPVDERYPEYDHKGMIHWDEDMTRYPNLPFRVQGVLALTDTDETMGGFQCIPETYQDIENFLSRQTKEQIESRNPDYTGYEITKPRLGAGDLLIWTTQLLHGNGHNVSDKPRLAQYISMNPVSGNEEQRRRRVELWQQNTHPDGQAFPGDPRRIEEARTEPASLTPLGRKLLGADPW